MYEQKCTTVTPARSVAFLTRNPESRVRFSSEALESKLDTCIDTSIGLQMPLIGGDSVRYIRSPVSYQALFQIFVSKIRRTVPCFGWVVEKLLSASSKWDVNVMWQCHSVWKIQQHTIYDTKS